MASDLEKLRELSEKATKGNWANRPGIFVDADIAFAAALVNWFRANESKLAEMEKDAERYRWLRNRVPSSVQEGLHFHFEAPMHGGGSLDATLEIHRAALDAAIDAEMGKERHE